MKERRDGRMPRTWSALLLLLASSSSASALHVDPAGRALLSRNHPVVPSSSSSRRPRRRRGSGRTRTRDLATPPIDDDDRAIVAVAERSAAPPSSSHRDVRRGGGGGGDDDDEPPAPASPGLLRSMRLLYLTYYASQGALMPYLPVYFHSLGHAGSAVGILGAVKPLTTFLVAPLWGILSDGSDNHVSVLQLTFVSSLLFQTLVGGWGVYRPSLRYLVGMVFVAAVLNAPVKSLIDSIVMGRLTSPEDRYQFGRMRLWGQIGFGVGSSMVGHLLSAFPAAPVVVDGSAARRGDGGGGASSVDAARNPPARLPRGYEWAFAAHAALSVPVFFCMRAFRPETSARIGSGRERGRAGGGRAKDDGRTATTDVAGGLRLLARNPDALVFFFLVFVIGTSSGCIENFAYMRVGEVGGTGADMGALRLVSSLAGAPMFWFSGPLAEALGTDVALVLSLLAYALRFFNYAWMTRPYHALPAEALRGLTFALFWSSGSTYASRISPPGMRATVLLIMNAMYGGLGQSLGAVLGGKLQSKLGTVDTFVVSGIFDACFVCALVVYLASGNKRAFSTTSLHP
jgi:hypothetical protein